MPALAKLTRPKLHQVVSRERLFARLDACRERPLVWVVGPPGAGKTSLVASWLSARKIGGCWIHVDPGDRDVSTFFYYLSQAAPAARKRDAPLPVLGPEHRADLLGFTRIYCRTLFARLKAPAALVFDNYHELPPDAELHVLLEAIAREAPDGCCVVAISRGDPPPACAALEATGRIARLDWDELRLTLDESRQIAALRHGVDDAALRAAHELAGGWPVGLALTLEQARRLGSGADSAGESREVLFEYFAGQIFRSLDADTRDALMGLALLPRATAADAARLTGSPGAGALLERLYRSRLFVDRRGEHFQFHDLFRAFLLQQLERTYPRDRADALRDAAITLLRAADRDEDAFALAVGAQRWDAAIAIVLGYAARLFEYGRLPTLCAWIDALPAAAIEPLPWMGLWRAVALSSVSPARARAEFARTFARFAPGVDDLARLLCCGGAVITYYLEFDDLEPLDAWIDEMLPLLALRPPLPPPAELRVNAALLFALSFRRPRVELLAPCIARVRALLSAPDIPANARIDAAGLLLAHHLNCADYEQAARQIASAEPWTADPQASTFYRAMWTLQVGRYEINRGDDDRGRERLESALALARDNALAAPLIFVSCHVGLADAALAHGDVAAAAAAREGMQKYWTAARRIDCTLDAGLRAYIATHRGDLASAVACAREQLALVDAIGVQYQRFGSRLQLAFALLESGASDQVPALLEEARGLLAHSAYAASAYQIELVEAYAALLRDDLDDAAAALERGLRGSRADAGLFAPRLQPRALPRLLAFALQRGIDRDYVRALIRRFDVRAPSPDAHDWPWPFEVRTLGRFEVLRDGAPLEFSRKVPKKTLALLKAIVALGGGRVSEQRLIDAFWSDEDGDAAARSLDATVLRLRALLGDAAAVVQKGGKVALDPERVWVDALAFERAVAAAKTRAQLEHALALYGGAFLADDEGEAWPVATRERLRGRFIHALVALGAMLEAAGELDAAIAAYQRGLDADAVVEAFYQGLMRCYARLDRRTEAVSAYRRLKQTLSITVGLAPSPATERLYRALRE